MVSLPARVALKARESLGHRVYHADADHPPFGELGYAFVVFCLAAAARAAPIGASCVQGQGSKGVRPPADDPVRLAALLIGVNAGPLITPWASLATLLWHARIVAAGVTLSWGRYALLGLVGAPLIVGGAVLALAATTV